MNSLMHFGQAVFQQFQKKMLKRIIIWGFLVVSLQCAYSEMVGDRKLMLTSIILCYAVHGLPTAVKLYLIYYPKNI